MKKILIPLLVCGLFACSKKDKDNPSPGQPEAVTEITAYLEGVDSLSEFAIAFKKTTITAAEAAGGLTVFAPGNESIGTYDLGARTMGKDLPDSVVKDHIVKGLFKVADLTDGKKLITLSGKELTVRIKSGEIYINNVKITFEDGIAGAQIVYTIAGMLSTGPGNADVTVFDAMQWSSENRSGLPAAGVSVRLYTTQEKYFEGTPDYTATTDANGIAHFTSIPVGNYYMVSTKGQLADVWPDTYKRSYVSTDSLYQTNEEVYNINTPYKYDAAPGDFRYSDLNQDGRIDDNDKVAAPFRVLTINDGALSVAKALIGYEENHTMRTFKTADEASLYLPSISSSIGVMHKELVMADGYMSDDAGCGAAPQWCAFDQYTFTASDNMIAEIWTGMYGSIKKLNRIIYSLPTMTGDTTELAAQARGLRAYAYFEMALYFGELPVYTDLAIPANISRSSLTNTYAFIKNELRIAQATLPATASSGSYRPLTSGAATALLARLSLVSGDFSAAVTYANQVIQSGRYQLAADTTQIFTNFEGPEIIWDLSMSNPYDFFDYFEGRGFCPVVRLSEMYLIVAEGQIALGNLNVAAQNINTISSRDGLGMQMITNPDEARTALVNTYKTDFRKEGYRFRNLVRWGLAAQTLGSAGYQSFNGLLPVTILMLQQYPNIIQNAGYN